MSYCPKAPGSSPPLTLGDRLRLAASLVVLVLLGAGVGAGMWAWNQIIVDLMR